MDFMALNKAAWDRRTLVHVESEFYDIKGFLAGKSSLNPIEIAETGDVKGKSLLHLQCHFGQDTLSWARMGAEVTGVDFSPAAIEQAQRLAEKAGLDAKFINDDVYHFGETNTEQFEVVFSSYGAVCWLPDLTRWASVIEKSLKPGGQFNLIEFHSFIDLVSGYSYFPADEPDVESTGTYTENCTGEKSAMAVWPHSLSEVINALIKAGIVIESFSEYPFSPYNCFEGLEHVEGKGYQLLFKGRQVPLVYSVTGRKAIEKGRE